MQTDRPSSFERDLKARGPYYVHKLSCDATHELSGLVGCAQNLSLCVFLAGCFRQVWSLPITEASFYNVNTQHCRSWRSLL